MDHGPVTIGQRVTSAAVDVTFLLVIAILGSRRVLSEGVLAGLFGSYASWRFGVAAGKSQERIAQAHRGNGNGNGNGDPPASSGSGSPPSDATPRTTRANARADDWSRRIVLARSPVLLALAFALGALRRG